MNSKALDTGRLSLVLFLFVLILAWFCYRPALTGGFHLDDAPSLNLVSEITDARSAASFVFAGEAGPIGRPLALASFAMQAGDWSEGAAPFLVVNILIHLLNALLIAYCCVHLAAASGLPRQRAQIIAVSTASIWVLMPLLATASLLVVQRMTTLSALFLLAGLAGYLKARSRLGDKPRAAWAGMSASLVLGTLAATLTKESGALLPLFVMVIEATILAQPRSIPAAAWRRWQAVFLWIPTVAILAYLATRWSYPESVVMIRDFTAWERLLTESRILWGYISTAVIGYPGSLGVFNDDILISRSLLDPATLAALVAWIAALVTARGRQMHAAISD